MELNVRDLELLYASGYSFYEQGSYEKAQDVFTGLIFHDPFQERFWKGLASSKQMDRKYKEALHAWGIFAILSDHSPEGHFHAAECLLSIGERKQARTALQLAQKKLQKNSDLSEKLHYLKEILSDGN